MKAFTSVTSSSETFACRSKVATTGTRVADDAADQAQQRSFGVVICRRQAGAVQHAIDAVQLAGGAQAGFPLRHQVVEKRLLHRAIWLGHGEQ